MASARCVLLHRRCRQIAGEGVQDAEIAVPVAGRLGTSGYEPIPILDLRAAVNGRALFREGCQRLQMIMRVMAHPLKGRAQV